MSDKTIFDPQPFELTGTIARLVPLGFEHAAGVLEAGNDDAIWTYLGNDRPRNRFEAEQWIANRLKDQSSGSRLVCAVMSMSDGRFAGSSGYSHINRQHRTLDIATWYGTRYQRTGMNTECKYMLLKYAFETLGAHRVGLTVDIQNIKSRKAVERLGAIQEGIIRKERIRKDGSHRDTVLFGFVDDDWPEVKAHLERLIAKY
ncbi:MAG: GNAT family N-acetyltransferase [Dehalococcoidia bacterium]|nr:GNAT family N-acetyltransferase [Dehalococcoidia bacterium]|tara:strand:+ start:7351 stop:7956 length:606 start_codon:yes stop_codon:yes gene_type:complete